MYMVFANTHLLCLPRSIFNLPAMSAPPSSQRTFDSLFAGASLFLAAKKFAECLSYLSVPTTDAQAPMATSDGD